MNTQPPRKPLITIMPDTELLIEELEARDIVMDGWHEPTVILTPDERDALIATVKQLRTEMDSWTTWHVKEGVNGCGHHPCHQYDLRSFTDHPNAAHGCVTCELEQLRAENKRLEKLLLDFGSLYGKPLSHAQADTLWNGAASSMRDKCVDAIKSLRAIPHGAAYSNAVNDAIRKCESLTLEPEKHDA